MILMFKHLEEVKDVNSFVQVDNKRIVKGNATALYFRIVQDKSEIEEHLAPLRYISILGATATVKFNHIDTNKVLTRVATQPFADDRSIWKIDILSTDTNVAFDSMSLTLTEGSNVINILAGSSLSAVDTGSGKLFC